MWILAFGIFLLVLDDKIRDWKHAKELVARFPLFNLTLATTIARSRFECPEWDFEYFCLLLYYYLSSPSALGISCPCLT